MAKIYMKSGTQAFKSLYPMETAKQTKQYQSLNTSLKTAKLRQAKYVIQIPDQIIFINYTSDRGLISKVSEKLKKNKQENKQSNF